MVNIDGANLHFILNPFRLRIIYGVSVRSPFPLPGRERVRVGVRKKWNDVNAEIVLISVSVGLAKLLPAYFARKDVVALAVFNHDLAVDGHRFHSWRMPFDFLRVDDVGKL